jgi:hypothetical protein
MSCGEKPKLLWLKPAQCPGDRSGSKPSKWRAHFGTTLLISKSPSMGFKKHGGLTVARWVVGPSPRATVRAIGPMGATSARARYCEPCSEGRHYSRRQRAHILGLTYARPDPEQPRMPRRTETPDRPARRKITFDRRAGGVYGLPGSPAPGLRAIRSRIVSAGSRPLEADSWHDPSRGALVFSRRSPELHPVEGGGVFFVNNVTTDQVTRKSPARRWPPGAPRPNQDLSSFEGEQVPVRPRWNAKTDPIHPVALPGAALVEFPTLRARMDADPSKRLLRSGCGRWISAERFGPACFPQ